MGKQCPKKKAKTVRRSRGETAWPVQVTERNSALLEFNIVVPKKKENKIGKPR